MKKYNLHLKKEYRGKQAIRYPEITGHEILGYSKSHCVLVGERLDMDLIVPEAREVYEVVMFTQKEIDELPHGFVKLFDIIEVKEELYYIKFPYANDIFLNEILHCGEVDFYGKTETNGFKTKFTMSEIEEKYSLLQSFAVKVEEIDNE